MYSNYAPIGSDLYCLNLSSVHVVVDTFTVANPWNFYASASSEVFPETIFNPYTFDILNTVHTEVNHDLYVAPWGDDNNSGLSQADPMRSVFMAMYRIASDSDNPKTVHVANGTYSAEWNGELFPIPVKSHTQLIGESRDGVMLDSGGSLRGIMISPRTENCLVSTLTIRNCRSGIFARVVSGLRVDNIRVTDSSHYVGVSGISGSYIYGTTHISNVKVDNLQSRDFASGVDFYYISGLVRLENIDISGLHSDSNMRALSLYTLDECDVFIDGCNVHDNTCLFLYESHTKAILLMETSSSHTTRLRVDLRNSAFFDNYINGYPVSPTAQSLNDTLFISNCTFAGNSWNTRGVSITGTSILTNNVFHNPDASYQLRVYSLSSSPPSHVTMLHNNLLGGTGSVINQSYTNTIVWGEGNTDYDPIFTYEGNRPYTLSPGSPLIDSGWQAAFAEPGFDAGGNERLWDGDGNGIAVIDKGAYEYQPILSPVNLNAELWNSQIFLSWDMPGVTILPATSVIPSTSAIPASSVIPAEAGIQPFSRGLSGYRVYRNNQSHADIEGAQNTWFRDRITHPYTVGYRVAALYGNVESVLSDSVVVIVTHVDSSDDLAPSMPTLSVGPNPFTDLAVVRYALPQAAKVELKIYNLRGQLVRTLDSGTKSAGEQIIPWEGCDDRAQALASGVYLLRMSVQGQGQMQRKLVLVK